MYIWTGIDVDDQFNSLKSAVKEAEKVLGYSSVFSSLPYHISLKMPFYIEENREDEIIDSILKVYKNAVQIKASIRGIEKEKDIVWIKLNEDIDLNTLCDELNEMLRTKYDIDIQEYDVDHEFHISLFIDEDERFIERAFDLVKDADISNKLNLSKLVVGVSKTGKPGTYEYIYGEE